MWLGITKRTLNVIRKFLFYHVFNRSIKKGKYRKSKNNFISHSFKILKLMLWVALSLVHFTQFSKEMKILSFASGRNILFLMILHFRRKRIKKMLLQSLIWCLTLTHLWIHLLCRTNHVFSKTTIGIMTQIHFSQLPVHLCWFQVRLFQW